MILRLIRAVFHRLQRKPNTVFPLTPPLPLPMGISEQQLFDFVTSICVQDAPKAEMLAYGTQDFRRFVYTWSLAKNAEGKCLELGGNPYFTTMLLKEFTNLESAWQIISATKITMSTLKESTTPTWRGR